MIFLSYAEEDGSTATAIAGWFRRHGVDVYFFQDSKRRGGRFISESASAIHSSEAFIALISPHFTRSDYCQLETDLATRREAEIRHTDPGASFIYVLKNGDVPLNSSGFLGVREWLDVSGQESRDRSLNDLLARLRPGRQPGPVNVPDRLPAPQLPGTGELSFRNRDDETGTVLRGLTNVAGPHFWLVVAPPQLGKTWFLSNLTAVLKERGDWTTRWLDVRDHLGELNGDALPLLARFFGMESPYEDEATTTRHIARLILESGQPHLCLLDGAELLSEGTASKLRKHFGEVYRRVQNAGMPDIRLGLIAAGRRDDEWRGVTPSPRIVPLALTEFKAEIVQYALRDLARQMGRDFGSAELGRIAGWVLGLSEGLPGLLEECLRWIKSEHWVDLGRLATPPLFEEIGWPYVTRWLLSQDSLLPVDPDRDARRQSALEHALRVLAPYRLFTQSHLRHHRDLDGEFDAALLGLDWSLEDLWNAISVTALLSRPLDEPWQVTQPAIRRLLFRYFYRSDSERAEAHRQARDFAKIWSYNQSGREQVIGLVEFLWHEASALQYGDMADMEERLSESARELVRSLRLSDLYTRGELRRSAVRRMRNDEEFQETVSSVEGLFDKLVHIVTPTEEH